MTGDRVRYTGPDLPPRAGAITVPNGAIGRVVDAEPASDGTDTYLSVQMPDLPMPIYLPEQQLERVQS